ncbi:hypothetical protein HCAG_07665 [Histoplasma mississippiense (nom. inval.)]|uniref:hypothetical protein n=1 Tax=Ajellomyces capsulatus (strain NAm1 / WU24) TaxID=2059318 RepID=UPI000157D01B|nr:hypothetical protein HCAG_07665 [Histoplasma mississippiense (nom. inval.)]EDN11212.1 hypothetical protein HCAG_07665 [Histoplasma mississippiense (nom. inval.)]
MGEEALASGETPVGCVLVHNDEVIGSGMNDTNKSMNGTRHAEFLAIEEVLRKSGMSILGAQMNVLEGLEVSSIYTPSESMSTFYNRQGSVAKTIGITFGSPGIDPPYGLTGGLFRKEAIMLLRRFYIQENERDLYSFSRFKNSSFNLAPNPKPKKGRELKNDFGEDASMGMEFAEILPLT